MRDEEEATTIPELYLHYTLSSQTNELVFLLTSARSEGWVDAFVERWNRKRTNASETAFPLGEVRIRSRRNIFIKQSEIDSEQWQAGLALNLMLILDRDLAEP
jgi:hypothetical protein